MRYGPISFVVGVLAVVFALGALQAERVRIPGSGYILKWLDAHGFVAAPNANGVVEISNASLLMVTDGRAIHWVMFHSWWFSGAAILLALWADRRHEDTLYLSAGFICGALALSLFSFYLGIGAMIGGAVVSTLIRRRRDG